MSERRTLKMHPRLLWDVIHRQAGTLSKAILEGVMNSVDAGGTSCDITIDRSSFTIVDDGKGFKDKDEIHRFFETFGYPHEKGDAVYGRFRMGRGQMFSFGVNKWSTNKFRMTVDLKPQENELGEEYALGYEFNEVTEDSPGCRITVDLYDELKPSDLDAVIRDIQSYVRYVKIPVSVNGKVVSSDPASEKWDEETDTVYIRKRASGSLDVYNQGVLVQKMPAYRYGSGGVVVSKVPLEVNFARNDIVNTCTVFKKVVSYLQSNSLEAAQRSAPLTEDQRENIAQRLASGDVTLSDVENARIITDVTGSHHKFEVFEKLSRFNNTISISERGNRVSEMAHTRKLAFVVTPETAARFGADTPEEFLQAISLISKTNRGRDLSHLLKVCDAESFHDVISSNHEPIRDVELNPAERMALRALRKGYETMLWYGRQYDARHANNTFVRNDGSRWGVLNSRRISVGSSDTAHAWTNGTTDIWINREQLRLIKDGMPGMIRLAGLLLHEQLHEGPSTGTHDHGVDFYERFHNISLDSEVITKCANEMLRLCIKELRNDGKKISRNLSLSEDFMHDASAVGVGAALDADPSDDAEETNSSPEGFNMAARA